MPPSGSGRGSRFRGPRVPRRPSPFYPLRPIYVAFGLRSRNPAAPGQKRHAWHFRNTRTTTSAAWRQSHGLFRGGPYEGRRPIDHTARLRRPDQDTRLSRKASLKELQQRVLFNAMRMKRGHQGAAWPFIYGRAPNLASERLIDRCCRQGFGGCVLYSRALVAVVTIIVALPVQGLRPS